MPVIVAFGDSNTWGYVPQLVADFPARSGGPASCSASSERILR
jgi:lysophospholipase L1-like esterase